MVGRIQKPLLRLFLALPVGIIGYEFTCCWQSRHRVLLITKARKCLEKWGYSAKDESWWHVLFSSVLLSVESWRVRQWAIRIFFFKRCIHKRHIHRGWSRCKSIVSDIMMVLRFSCHVQSSSQGNDRKWPSNQESFHGCEAEETNVIYWQWDWLVILGNKYVKPYVSSYIRETHLIDIVSIDMSIPVAEASADFDLAIVL